jgi:hypothetical protein
MTIIGCDFHPGFQKIAFVDKQSGEYGKRRSTYFKVVTGLYRFLAGS